MNKTYTLRSRLHNIHVHSRKIRKKALKNNNKTLQKKFYCLRKYLPTESTMIMKMKIRKIITNFILIFEIRMCFY